MVGFMELDVAQLNFDVAQLNFDVALTSVAPCFFYLFIHFSVCTVGYFFFIYFFSLVLPLFVTMYSCVLC